MEEIKRIGRNLVHKGAVIDYYQDDMLMPDGKVVKWDFIGHKGAAAVVGVTPEGKILMVKQFRNAIDRISLEIPAGARDSVDEPTEICAARELEEETGFRAGKLEWLLTLRTAIAYCNEFIDVYVATDLVPTKQHLDPDEYLDVYQFTMEELCEMIYSGEMQDTKTISALLAYKDKYLK